MIFKPRLPRIRLRLRRTILRVRSLHTRLRLVRVRLRTIFKPRVSCIRLRLRLHRAILYTRFIAVGLAVRCIRGTLVHVRSVGLRRTALRHRTSRLNTRSGCNAA